MEIHGSPPELAKKDLERTICKQLSASEFLIFPAIMRLFRSGKFKPDEFENHYVEALKELIDKKMKGQKIVAPREEVEPRKVPNLMAALKRSLGDVPEKPRAKPHGAPAARRQATGRRAAKR